ncbi:MAG: hypothetical protein FGM34_00715 [Solirubrobacteraceae bacterium]|nr:hypothetical protein [Solirubrobacteraceae bacterium]
MSSPAIPEMVPAPGVIPCPRCGEWLAVGQDWCLRCGDPARTVIAPSPKWRRPLLAILALGALALGVMVAAFIALTSDDPPPARTTTQTIPVQPGEPLAPGVTPAPTTATPAPEAPPTTDVPVDPVPSTPDPGATTAPDASTTPQAP